MTTTPRWFAALAVVVLAAIALVVSVLRGGGTYAPEPKAEAPLAKYAPREYTPTVRLRIEAHSAVSAAIEREILAGLGAIEDVQVVEKGAEWELRIIVADFFSETASESWSDSELRGYAWSLCVTIPSYLQDLVDGGMSDGVIDDRLGTYISVLLRNVQSLHDHRLWVCDVDGLPELSKRTVEVFDRDHLEPLREFLHREARAWARGAVPD